MSLEFYRELSTSSYAPNTFSITLGTGIVVGEGKIQECGLPRFLHEYAHFIQDTRTVFGACDFLAFYERACCVASSLVGKKVTNNTNLANEDGVIQCNKLRSLIYSPLEGDFCIKKDLEEGGIKWRFKRWEVVTNEIKVSRPEGYQVVPVLVVTFYNENHGDYRRALCAKEIKEAYAVAVEEHLHCLDDCCRDADAGFRSRSLFVYEACDAVLEGVLTSGLNHRQKIAVYHWALQSRTPGIRFMEILELMTTWNGLPSEIEIFDRLRTQFAEDVRLQWEELLHRASAMVSRESSNRDLQELLRGVAHEFEEAMRRSCSTDHRFPLDSLLCDNRLVGSGEIDLAAFTDDPLALVLVPGSDECTWLTTQNQDSKVDAARLFLSITAWIMQLTRVEPYTKWICPFHGACRDERRSDAPCLVSAYRMAGCGPQRCLYGMGGNCLGVGGEIGANPDQ